MDFEKLLLPPFEINIIEHNTKLHVRCLVRKKIVALTPEEWVRQHILNYMNTLGYSFNLISVESTVKYNNLNKRFDILIFDKFGKVIFLIECKAPRQNINIKSLEQISVYNKVLKSKYLILTNGLKLYCLKLDDKDDKCYAPMKYIPRKDEVLIC